MVVHCSAGVGRSGVFCTLYALLSYLPYIGHAGHSGAIDIAAYVRHMRKSRRFMVQTLDQYKFCFFAGLHGATQYLAAVEKTGGPVSLHTCVLFFFFFRSRASYCAARLQWVHLEKLICCWIISRPRCPASRTRLPRLP